MTRLKTGAVIFTLILAISICSSVTAFAIRYNSQLDNVIDVSPGLRRPYDQISTAIAQIPPPGNPGAPTTLSPVLVRVYPGTYIGGFSIPANVTVRGTGRGRIIIANPSNIPLPVVYMTGTANVLENVAVGWGTIDGLDFQPPPTTCSPGASDPQGFGGCALVAVKDGSELRDVQIGAFPVPPTLTAIFGTSLILDRVETGMSGKGVVAIGGATIRNSTIAGNQDIGVQVIGTSIFCGGPYVSNSKIAGVNASVALGTCPPFACFPGPCPPGPMPGHIATSELDGPVTTPFPSNLKIVHSYDGEFNPIPNQ